MTTGIDLCSISRMEQSIKRPRFLERVFSPAEQALIQSRGPLHAAACAAANFAGKEAFAKALGTGVSGFSLREVEVLRDSRGAPYLQLSGRAEALARQRRLAFSISLTHEQDLAAAFVIGWEGTLE